MKLIKSIVRPNKVDDVKGALEKLQISGMTVTEVRGHGKQKGHTAIYRGQEYNVSLLPKMEIEVVVPDSIVDDAIKAIIEAARTGEIGDGRVFVIPGPRELPHPDGGEGGHRVEKGREAMTADASSSRCGLAAASGLTPRRGGRRTGQGLGRRGQILDDEDRFAGLHQPEIPARRLFERILVLAQPPVLILDEGVLGFQAHDLIGQPVQILAGPGERHQPLIPDEGVDEHDRRKRQDQQMHEPPCPLPPPGLMPAVVRPPIVSRPESRDYRQYLTSTRRTTAQNLVSSQSARRTSCACAQVAMTNIVIVLTTMPPGDAGDELARTLIDERLAACVNVCAPMTSVYRWEGRVTHDLERQLVIKTTVDRVAAVRERLSSCTRTSCPSSWSVPCSTPVPAISTGCARRPRCPRTGEESRPPARMPAGRAHGARRATIRDAHGHSDRHLPPPRPSICTAVTASYGPWIYALLFVVVFAETGLVVTPILPGDSLLFAAGALAATGALNPVVVVVVLLAAAIAGDAVNYAVGRAIGPRIFTAHDVVQPVAPPAQSRPSRAGARLLRDATAARRWCSAASCRSSARSCPSSPAAAPCRIRSSRSTT